MPPKCTNLNYIYIYIFINKYIYISHCDGSSPAGVSSERHREPRHSSEGLCVQELQPDARGPLPLPGGLPAPAVAGPPGLLSGPRLLPGVRPGPRPPPGELPFPNDASWCFRKPMA